MADITINEVRRRLQLFANEHSGDRDEKQYAQQFMRDFYACFGLSKSSASMFEKKVLKFGNKRGEYWQLRLWLVKVIVRTPRWSKFSRRQHTWQHRS